MLFADLTDTSYIFNCELSDDYWDYGFSASELGRTHYRSMTTEEVIQLRRNCRRILNATKGVQQQGEF